MNISMGDIYSIAAAQSLRRASKGLLLQPLFSHTAAPLPDRHRPSSTGSDESALTIQRVGN